MRRPIESATTVEIQITTVAPRYALTPRIEMSETIRLTMINETIVEASASRPARPTDGWRISTRRARKLTIRNTTQKTIVASRSPVVELEKPSKDRKSVV